MDDTPTSPPATAGPRVGVHAPTLDRLTPRELAPTPLDPESEKKTTAPPPPLVLRVAIRPGRMTVLTVISIGSIIALVSILHRGHELARYQKDGMTQTEQIQLLDKYNSYAGNVGAVFGKPIELFVLAAVQVLVLRFLTTLLLRPQPDRRVTLFALALSTGIGYMIGNGFNAINVQFHDLPIQPVILASDLSVESNVSNAQYADRTTTIELSIPETIDKNPTTNTILRTLVLPREPKPIPKCDWYRTQLDFRAYIPDDVLEFGMPQREWMKTLVPEALESPRLEIIVNASDPNANANVRVEDLPMPARRAANMVLHGLFLSSQYIPWGKNEYWGDEFVNMTFLRDGASQRTVSTAMLTGLMPVNTSTSEMEQRARVLQQSPLMIAQLFANGSANMSQSDIRMAFTHTQLSPSITFDALTFDVDVDPALYTTARDKQTTTRYYQLTKAQCAPWPGRCMIEKRDQPPFAGLQAGTLYDAPMQIHAYAVCLDANDSEKMQSGIVETFLSDYNVLDCTKHSNRSMLLVSVAKKLHVDALLQNTVVDEKNRLVAGDGVVAVNLTKTYSFTVGRLGWTLQDLSKTFGAKCNADGADCTGLSIALSDGEHELVVGTAALPLNLLSGLYLQHDSQQRPISLVHVTEPPRQDHPGYAHIAGDLLYPHNVKDFSWVTNASDHGTTNCSAHQEDRVRLVLNNHMYMESTLQATYTAGLFFLFQDGVPHRVVAFDVGNHTLDFDGNVHEVALWLSIPLENTALTITGCVLLAFALFVALIWSLFCRMTKRPDPLARITTPHVIARAMLDESQFPSLLLHRRVMDTSDGFEQRTVAAFEIRSLLLQHQKNHDHRAAATA